MDVPRQHALPNIIQDVAQQSFQLRLGDWLVLFILGAIAVFRLGDGRLWGKPDPNLYMWYVAPQKSGDSKMRPKKTRDIGKRLQETVWETLALSRLNPNLHEANNLYSCAGQRYRHLLGFAI